MSMAIHGKNTIGGAKARAAQAAKVTGILILFIFYMMPFFLVLINSFKLKKDIIKTPFSMFPASGLTFENYTVAFEKMHFLNAFGNSLFITGLATFFVIMLSAMLAYYIVRANNLAGKAMYSTMIASMIIPFQAIMIPLVSIYGAQLGLLNHRLTLVFLHTGFAMSMSMFMYSGFIKSSIPLSLEEAAYLDGCTRVQTFSKVVFPLLKPITATLVILNVLAFWNDFLLPSLVLGRRELFTLPLSTYLFYGTYTAAVGNIMASLILTVSPILIMYLFLQRQIIKGVVTGAVKA